MPKYCAAFGCNNSSQNPIIDGNKISFHKFPLKNNELLRTWLARLKRENFSLSEHSVLCSVHFEEDCFVYQNFTNIRLLKKDAVPSLFTFRTGTKRKRTTYEFDNSSSETMASDGNNEIQNVEIVGSAEPTIKNVETQTEGLHEALIPLISSLNAEVANLREMLKKSKHSSENVPDDKTMIMLTGFSKLQFRVIHDFLNLQDEIKNSKEDLFMFLVRLKNGLSEEFIAYMFEKSQSTISVHLNAIIDIVYEKVKDVRIWPSREKVKKHMPPIFKRYFPSCRVIIDSTEFKIQKPSGPVEQQVTFSFYKNCNTLKCLVGISPSGAICFLSTVYGGAISDKELFRRSNLLQLLESGDSVLADRGFTVQKEIESVGCRLHTPLFLKDKIQFNLVERRENKKVSRHRVHVERAIGSIKKFRFFEGPIPYGLLHSIEKVIYITAFLTLFGNPLIK